MALIQSRRKAGKNFVADTDAENRMRSDEIERYQPVIDPICHRGFGKRNAVPRRGKPLETERGKDDEKEEDADQKERPPPQKSLGKPVDDRRPNGENKNGKPRPGKSKEDRRKNEKKSGDDPEPFQRIPLLIASPRKNKEECDKSKNQESRKNVRMRHRAVDPQKIAEGGRGPRNPFRHGAENGFAENAKAHARLIPELQKADDSFGDGGTPKNQESIFQV
ncbi:hypothetical protein M1413_01010 [Patescibacteria group bacterium]|nr:hypothetical protein [Patescibacteria group bacterium]MCL5114333.1 hypothetical protein [Patescibacteria group bacterium]